MDRENKTITAEAGASLPAVSQAALSAGLTGLEFAAGIPGTMGGGLFMNAGAYGGELKQVVTEAAVMTAMAKFFSDLWFVDDFREQPEYLSEIFETILLTKMGDDQDLRIRMINSIRTSKILAETLGSFSDKEINKACEKMIKA